MARFCTENCKKKGVICGNCDFFIEEKSEKIILKDTYGEDMEGICSQTGNKVHSKDTPLCNEFACFEIIGDKYIEVNIHTGREVYNNVVEKAVI